MPRRSHDHLPVNHRESSLPHIHISLRGWLLICLRHCCSMHIHVHALCIENLYQYSICIYVHVYKQCRALTFSYEYHNQVHVLRFDTLVSFVGVKTRDRSITQPSAYYYDAVSGLVPRPKWQYKQ